MDELELRLQRVFDRVELVSGIGNPGAGVMCVMSFVACLAGEGHTDHPSCASPVVRAFAIPVNDRMPHGTRQRLKPFAPRILGTNDGRDAARAALLARALAEEILPRASALYRASPAALRRLWLRLRRRELHRRVAQLVDQGEGNDGRWPGREVLLARAAGQLVALCARDARDAREAEWYWTAAIGLLDRLCEVGAAERRRRAPGVRTDRLAWLEAALRPRPGAGGRAGATQSHAPPSLWAGVPGLAKATDEA